MDCQEFRQYLGGFSDDELEVLRNHHALAHLHACPDCTARIQNITSLRNALARTYADVRAPEHLSDRITSALETGAGLSAPSLRAAPLDPSRPGEQPVDRDGILVTLFRKRSTRWVVPLGMAASLVMMVGVWRLLSDTESQSAGVAVGAGQVVADVREQHNLCVRRRGLQHHDKRLTRALDEIASRLGRDVKLAVWAPDLSAQGFELVGADRCGVRGRPGAHILYHSASIGATLSVFTISHQASLETKAAGPLGDDRPYFVSSDSSLCVVAWHRGPQTYFVCGELPERVLLALVDQVRVVDRAPPRGFAFALGFIQR